MIFLWLELFLKVSAISLQIVYEGLKPVVQQSTVFPSSRRALRSQTWLRKIDARSCADLFSYRTNRRNFLHRFFEAMSGFAKLLSLKGKLWIIALLFGSLLIMTVKSSNHLMLIHVLLIDSTFGFIKHHVTCRAKCLIGHNECFFMNLWLWLVKRRLIFHLKFFK